MVTNQAWKARDRSSQETLGQSHLPCSHNLPYPYAATMVRQDDQ
jgi:hypothetical protein